MTAPDHPATVGSRLEAAGVSPERAAAHLAAGRVELDGVQVSDLSTPAPAGTRIVLRAS